MNEHRQCDQRQIYQIKVQGILDEKWSDWFDGLIVHPLASGETLLTGPVADQAALHGLLTKIRDIGLPLLAVNRLETADEAPDSGERHHARQALAHRDSQRGRRDSQRTSKI